MPNDFESLKHEIGNYFTVLGGQTELGRLLTPDDDITPRACSGFITNTRLLKGFSIVYPPARMATTIMLHRYLCLFGCHLPLAVSAYIVRND